MSEPIKPALTAEEWTHREFAIKGDNGHDALFGYVDLKTNQVLLGWNGDRLRPISRLAPLAALCLYGQPFGFTREDVQFLRALATHHEVCAETNPSPLSREMHAHSHIKCRSLADRIEALLPHEP